MVAGDEFRNAQGRDTDEAPVDKDSGRLRTGIDEHGAKPLRRGSDGRCGSRRTRGAHAEMFAGLQLNREVLDSIPRAERDTFLVRHVSWAPNLNRVRSEREIANREGRLSSSSAIHDRSEEHQS